MLWGSFAARVTGPLPQTDKERPSCRDPLRQNIGKDAATFLKQCLKKKIRQYLEQPPESPALIPVN